jgi:proteasome accessory factor A
VDPARGLALKLQDRGSLQRLTTEAEVVRAVQSPPEDTRAYFRGECMRRYGADVAAASWDSVIFDVPGQDHLQRVPTLEPLRGTKAHVGQLLDASPTAVELLAALAQ